eukprot:8438419-Alexandrium_andersonii.AAC.1
MPGSAPRRRAPSGRWEHRTGRSTVALPRPGPPPESRARLATGHGHRAKQGHGAAQQSAMGLPRGPAAATAACLLERA